MSKQETACCLKGMRIDMILAYGYGYYSSYFDPTYILVLIGIVLTLWASAHLNHVYSHYARIRSMSGMTGAEVAQRLLSANGMSDVRVEHIGGNLTDHYDPSARVLRLSDATYA